MQATLPERSFAVGEHVKLQFGRHDVVGRVIEDYGPIGLHGRQLLRVEAYLPLDERVILDMPAEELAEARCHGHLNGFRHLDPGISSLEPYDLGLKRMDEPAPPPPGSPSEPRLYLFVSVRGLDPLRDRGTIHYARSRTFLRDGFPSSDDDRRRFLDAVIHRLEDDIAHLVAGELHTSEATPIFLRGEKPQRRDGR